MAGMTSQVLNSILNFAYDGSFRLRDLDDTTNDTICIC